MTLYGVSFEPIGKQPIVLLKTADDDKFLPIWIGTPKPPRSSCACKARRRHGR